MLTSDDWLFYKEDNVNRAHILKKKKNFIE